METSREQYADQMSRIATLPSACEGILMFRMYLLLGVIQQPAPAGDRQPATCLRLAYFTSWLLRCLNAAWSYLIKVYEWTINNGRQRTERIWIPVWQVLNNK